MHHHRCLALALAVLLVGLAPLRLQAQGTPSGARTQTAIELDISDADIALNKISESPAGFLDKDQGKHADMLTVAVPLLKKRIALAEEWSRVTKDFASTRITVIYHLALLHALGDDETVKLLDKMVRGSDANYAKLCTLLSGWFTNSADAAAQSKVVEAFHAMAKAFPTEDTVAHTAILMLSTPASKPELSLTLEDTLYKDLRGPEALRWKVLPHVGRALVLSGTLLNGQNYSTAKLKGKVLLVHFWTPTHSASRSELAELRQIQLGSREQGLEVIGVVGEISQSEATRYLADNKYNFPQFYDAKTPPTQPHPFMALYDVRDYNMLMVIDRAGNFRALVAPAALAELLPKLLAEKVPEKATTEPGLRN